MLSISAIVGVVLGSALVLLVLVLFIIVVFRRRRKHVRHSSSMSRSRRLPTFADMTLRSEITSFLPAASSMNGLRSFDFGRRTSTGGEVCRQPTAETDDMPPSYDSVVKTSDVVRRRKDGNSASSVQRSQARLSLPPLSATAFPPILRTHRRAESDVEEHVYEDPASLRRSVSRDGLGHGLRNSAEYSSVNCHEVSEENDGPSSSEVDDRSPLELLMSLVTSPDDAVALPNPPELLQSLPYPVASNSSLNAPMSSYQPRVPRVRLGTSALYGRPDSRSIDWCRNADFPASTNQLRPFSPLSTIGYSELIDSFMRQYQTPGDDFSPVHNSPNPTSFGVQQPFLAPDQWSQIYGNDPGLELRSQAADEHSTPAGNWQNRHPSTVSHFSDDLSAIEDHLNSTSSARSSLTESERMCVSQVSPLFDDDNVLVD